MIQCNNFNTLCTSGLQSLCSKHAITLSKVPHVVGVEQDCSVMLSLCMVQLSRRVHRVSHTNVSQASNSVTELQRYTLDFAARSQSFRSLAGDRVQALRLHSWIAAICCDCTAAAFTLDVDIVVHGSCLQRAGICENPQLRAGPCCATLPASPVGLLPEGRCAREEFSFQACATAVVRGVKRTLQCRAPFPATIPKQA